MLQTVVYGSRAVRGRVVCQGANGPSQRGAAMLAYMYRSDGNTFRQEKLRFLFHITDLNGSGLVSAAEMESFLQVLLCLPMSTAKTRGSDVLAIIVVLLSMHGGVFSG